MHLTLFLTLYLREVQELRLDRKFALTFCCWVLFSFLLSGFISVQPVAVGCFGVPVVADMPTSFLVL